MIDVGFVGTDDAVRGLLVAVEVREHDRGAEAHLVAAELRGVDHLGAGQLVLDVLQPRLDQALPLLGGVVLGVLAQVAVLAGNPYVSRDLRPLFLEARELVFELLSSPGCHRNLVDPLARSDLPTDATEG